MTDEEKIVLQAIESHNGENLGIYVDIGADNPDESSQTNELYRKGWRGLLIEPNPNAWQHLLHKRVGDFLLPRAISDVTSRRIFTINGSNSCVCEDDDPNNPQDDDKTKITVECDMLYNVLNQFPLIKQNCMFLNIGVPGYEQHIFASVDLFAFRPTFICTTAISSSSWVKFLTPFYTLLEQTVHCNIYKRK